MSAEEYRRKAQHFLNLARQISSPQDRAVLIRLAASWKERADEVERNESIQQEQKQPEKEPEGERS